MSDILIVFSMIASSAHNLGLAKDSEQVKNARKIAIAAIDEGHSDEDAFSFARAALVPGACSTAA